MKNLNMAKLSKEDELSVRKTYIERILKECKKQTEDKVMILLASAIDKDVEMKNKGQIVFLERWLKDLDKELYDISSEYEHDQIVSSNIWIITHNLNKYPSVTIIDSAGSVVNGDVRYVDKKSLVISFTLKLSGKAFLN